MTYSQFKNINWKKDGLTANFVRENAAELLYPEKMTENRLCDAITYCISIDNPYSVELLTRTGYLDDFQRSRSSRERMEYLREAARRYRIILF